MRVRSFVFVSALSVLSVLSGVLASPGALRAQTPPPIEKPPVEKPPAVQAEVPAFANQTCPIMGKKVSLPLFVDTELGRIYLCCKPCSKKVLADVATAHRTAYANVQPVANATCPVSGEAIGASAVDVTLQGYRFKVCCAGCVDQARTHSQVTLTKVARASVADVGNATCPLTSQPVTANAFVVIDGAIVHLAAPALADDASKDPAAVLAKARAIAKAQPPKPKHEHRTEPPKEKDKEKEKEKQEPGK